MGAIAVNGVRGLRIDDLRLTAPIENGPSIRVDAEAAFINIQLNDLFYGRVNVENIVLDGSKIVVERPLGSEWFTPGEIDFTEYVPFEIEGQGAFRLTGSDGVFEARNVVGQTSIRLEAFDFDVSRLSEATDLNAVLRGHLAGEPEKRVRVRLALNSFEDFDLQVKTDLITAEDVNIVLPADQHLVLEGAVHPTLWINGRPNRTLVVTLDAPFEDIVVRDHPEFLEAASGMLTMVATYATDAKLLTVSTATADTNQLDGTLKGTVSFAEDYPAFDLNLSARRIPVADLVEYIWPGQVTEHGRMDLTLDEPHELEVALAGTSQAPRVTARTRSSSGEFVFTPAEETLPAIQLALNQIEGIWDSGADDLKLRFDIVDGVASQSDWGFTIEDMRGQVALSDGTLRVSPLNARCNGKVVFAEAEYNIETESGRAEFSGSIANLESTIFANGFRNLRVAGAVELSGVAELTAGTLGVEADVDATQSAFDFKWWARKERGIGANAHVTARLDGNTNASIEVRGDVASSDLWARIHLAKRDRGTGPRWRVMDMVATSNAADINSAARLARVPYRVTGGTLRDLFYQYTHDPNDFDTVYHGIGGAGEEISLLALT